MDPVLALSESRPFVQPGGEARVTLTVRNVGELVEQYRLEVLGEAARWAQVVPRQISVLPAGREEKTVEVVFRPPRPPATVAGELPFGVRCVSLEHRDRAAVVEGDVVVGEVHDVRARLEPVSPEGRWTGRYKVLLDNTGSVPVHLALAAADSRRLLRFALAPGELTIQPGQTAEAYLSVRPRQPILRGKPVPHAFAVHYRTVRGEERTGELPGSFGQRPVLSTAVLVTGLLGLAAVGTLAALLLRRGDQAQAAAEISGPPPPVAITTVGQLTATSAQIVWERSPYATGYVVQQVRDGTALDSKRVDEPDQTTLAWSGLRPGEHCFRVLVAGQQGRSAPSEPRCLTLARPKQSPTPTAGASPSPTPAPGAATTAPAPTSAAPPTAGGGQVPVPPGGPTQPTAPAGDPVQGFYVIYVPPVAIEDEASRGVADAEVARLQRAGIPAELIDSRRSDQLDDATNGLWVVVRSGFASFAEARAECDAVEDEAPDCRAASPR